MSSVDIQSGLVSVAQNELVSLGVFECLPYQLTDDQVISVYLTQVEKFKSSLIKTRNRTGTENTDPITLFNNHK